MIFRLILMVFVCAAVLACPPDPPSGVRTACVPGHTTTCACSTRGSGTQTCQLDGSGYGECEGCPIDPCSTATSCASCTPLAGCGWCGARSQCVTVNASCTGPAAGSCGDGWACRASECAPNVCAACRTNIDCGASGVCGVRSCDGSRACVPTAAGGACDVVGGLVCPSVAMFHQCTTDAQCGPRMRCIAVWPGQTERVCTLPCTGNAECPTPAPGGIGVTFCGTSDFVCHFSCNRAGACDASLSCRTASLDGAYHFCL